MAYRGDLIACEVDFKEVPDGKISVLFSLNGEEVGRSSMKYTSGQTLYPIVSMGFPGIKVLAKVCSKEGEGEGDGLEIKAVNGLASLVICLHIILRHALTASRDCSRSQLEA